MRLKPSFMRLSCAFSEFVIPSSPYPKISRYVPELVNIVHERAHAIKAKTDMARTTVSIDITSFSICFNLWSSPQRKGKSSVFSIRNRLLFRTKNSEKWTTLLSSSQKAVLVPPPI